MKSNVLCITIVVGIAFSSCNATKSTSEKTTVDSTENVAQSATIDNVVYEIAKNYFVKNTYKNEQIETLKITTQEKFDEVFGMAATMGKNGMPTKIDFSKQFVAAIVGQEMNKEVNFQVNSFVKKGDEIVLTYAVMEGKELSFSIQPSLILVLDKAWDGTLKFEKK